MVDFDATVSALAIVCVTALASADFSNWIKAQIDRARLIESRDFLKVAQKGELSATGQIRLEYFLTVDAAKHVAMLSGTFGLPGAPTIHSILFDLVALAGATA